MSWKNTWTLVGLAAALFAFIMLFERRLDPTGAAPPPKPLFASFKPSAATSLQLRRGTQFTLLLERTNDHWHFTKPVPYPAASVTIRSLLDALDRTVPAVRISPSEMRSRKQSLADFGLDASALVLVLEQGGERRELHFGSRTATGDQVYVEVLGQGGVSILPADLLEKLPRTPFDWRDTALFHFGEERMDRAEITHGGTSYVLQLDATNKQWRLTRPSHRADQGAVAILLKKILETRVAEFITDDPRGDIEAYGLQTPEFEVTLGSGLRSQKVQFGRSPTNDPTRLYARLMDRTNLVLVPQAVTEALTMAPAELRDQQLVAFAPEMVDMIEARGEEEFTLRKNPSGTWVTGEVPADSVLVAQLLNLLSSLRVREFVKDVVTDFAPFGLSTNQRQFTLRTSVTNGFGVTNVVLAQIAFGTNGGTDRAFARRLDEESVYSISPLEFTRLPVAAWQLREHRVWSFSTNQVAKITVTQGTEVREALRQPNGQWIEVKGFNGDINPFALEEIALRLGDLNAVAWMARGPGARERYGFSDKSPRLSVELRGEKPVTLTIEFGGRSPLQLPYASSTSDGQPAVFEFPWQLYSDLQIYFKLASPAARKR